MFIKHLLQGKPILRMSLLVPTITLCRQQITRFSKEQIFKMLIFLMMIMIFQ